MVQEAYDPPEDWSETVIELEEYDPPRDWSETVIVLEGKDAAPDAGSVWVTSNGVVQTTDGVIDTQ